MTTKDQHFFAVTSFLDDVATSECYRHEEKEEEDDLNARHLDLGLMFHALNAQAAAAAGSGRQFMKHGDGIERCDNQ